MNKKILILLFISAVLISANIKEKTKSNKKGGEKNYENSDDSSKK